MFKVLVEGCEPKRATKYSAYVDLYAREDVTIGAGETKIIPLGIKIDIDSLYHEWYRETMSNPTQNWFRFLSSHYLEIAIRSSLAVKGLIIANGSGKVDLDYPDEIGIILHNPINYVTHTIINHDIRSFGVNDSVSCVINKGDKVAQCTLIEHRGYLMGYESEEERVGGFGSTGDK